MQAVLRDVDALPDIKLGIGLLEFGNPGLQSTTCTQYAAHRL